MLRAEDTQQLQELDASENPTPGARDNLHAEIASNMPSFLLLTEYPFPETHHFLTAPMKGYSPSTELSF